MDSFGTTKIAGFDHDSNSLYYFISDSKGSLDLRIDRNCPMQVDANVNSHISCTINHG